MQGSQVSLSIEPTPDSVQAQIAIHRVDEGNQTLDTTILKDSLAIN